MAKLENVKVLDMVGGDVTKIEYNGDVYDRIEASNAEKGDIGLRVSHDKLPVNVGSYYEIIGNTFGGIDYIDNDGDESGTLGYDYFEVFRKVADQSQAKDSVAVGDKVRIIEGGIGGTLCLSGFSGGEVCEVIEIDDTEIPIRVRSLTTGRLGWSTLENVVKLEEAEDPQPLFAKVNRPNNEPIAGDYVEFEEDRPYTTNGKKYEIIDIDAWGDPRFIDDDGDEVDADDIKTIYVKYTQEQAEQKAQVGDKVLVVNEDGAGCNEHENGEICEVRIADGSMALVKGKGVGLYSEEFIVLTPEQVGEVEGEGESETDTPTQQLTPSSFKTGEKVRLLSGGGEWPLMGYENGEIYEVSEMPDYADHDPSEVVTIEGSAFDFGYAKPSQLEKVEGIAEEGADGDVEKPLIPVGSYAKVVDNGGKWHFLKVGDIVEVKKNDDPGGTQPYFVKRVSDGCPSYLEVDQLAPASDEEGAESGSAKFSVGDYVVNHRDTVGLIDRIDSGRAFGEWLYNLTEGAEDYPVKMEYYVDDPALRHATQEEIAKALGIDTVQVGDKVEVLAEDHFKYEKGDTLVVADIDCDGDIRDEEGVCVIGFFFPTEPRFKVVEKAADKTSETSQEFNEGDIVVVIDDPSPANEIGDIGEITRGNGNLFTVKVPGRNDSSNWELPRTVRHATPEEKAEFKRKQAEAEGKPSKIEEGDLVEVINDCRGLPVGSVFKVTLVDSDGIIYGTSAGVGVGDFIYGKEHVKLIAKAADLYV